MIPKSTLRAVVCALAGFPLALQTSAGLFKIDFGHLQNEAEIIQYDLDYFNGEVFGSPIPFNTGEFPKPLTDWTVIPTWTFANPNENVTAGSASAEGTANAEGTEVTWKLKDASTAGGDNDVTLTILDNKELAIQANPETPAFMLGQTANNPTHEGFAYLDFDGNPIPLPAYQRVAEIVYDTVLVPYVVKDDYLYRNPDNAGTESLMRIGNLNPGFYNVTVFEGRTTDGDGRYGKVWVDDITGSHGPAAANTGNYAGVGEGGRVMAVGQPRTVTVSVGAGQYLWFAEMEDNSGGISGMIVRSVDTAPPPADVTSSPGLFKIDFGHIENEREIVDAEGIGTGTFPALLNDWTIIPTWTFADPNSDVTEGSASAKGTANADKTAVTWNLIDSSKDKTTGVTMTIMDNAALTASSGGSPALGQTANNPTKENYEILYDGVVVPGVVKDDYNYRNPDGAGSELLMRFAGLKPGKYNVTVFEGRTTDGDGRFGKVWVDDITGAKEPATQNTGSYAGTGPGTNGAVAAPGGQPRTVTVTLAANQYLWFAEMEDNSGGISGMIIRGIAADGGGPVTGSGKLSVAAAGGKVNITWGGSGTLQQATSITGPWTDISGAANPYPATPAGSAGFFRVRN